MKIKNKRAQVTIFIIIALIIIVSIAIIFVLVKKPAYFVSATPEVNLQKCIEESLGKAEAQLVEGNFYINISNNYIVYRGEKAKYLCKAAEFYVPCINQEPALIEKLRKDIYNMTKKDIENCFNSMTNSFKESGYDAAMNETKIPIRILFEGDYIIAEINKSITLKKGGEIRSFSGFSGKTKSQLFSFAKTATSIVNYESTFCEFNPSSWMSEYPNIIIKRFVASEGTKVYTLSDANSEKSMSFAVKSCVLPAGI